MILANCGKYQNGGNWFSSRQPRVLSHYSDLMLSQEFQPMAAQLSLKAALPSAKILATASGPGLIVHPMKYAHGYVCFVLLWFPYHVPCGYNCDVIMGLMSSPITSLTIVYSSVYSGADQRKSQSFVSLAFVRGIHRWPVNSQHKGSVTRKMVPFITSSWEIKKKIRRTHIR